MLSPEQSVVLCDRNFGIGGDGVIFALPGANDCDYTMRIYNADGSEPQMCGNGIRCMARFLVEIEGEKLLSDKEYKIWTGAGTIVPKVMLDGSIEVDMGKPVLTAALVPTTLTATSRDVALEADLEVIGHHYKATCVSMGNPHAVCRTPQHQHILKVIHLFFVGDFRGRSGKHVTTILNSGPIGGVSSSISTKSQRRICAGAK